jgi:hypothetical protein
MSTNSKILIIIIIVLLVAITAVCAVLYFMEKDKKKVSFNIENSINPKQIDNQQNVDEDEDEDENENLQLIQLNFDNMPTLGVISSENYKKPNCGKNWDNLDPNSGLSSLDCQSQSYPQSLDDRRE